MQKKTVAIHQPHFFPWLGYFDKLAKADQFVILDEVQFEKGSFMNRNQVLDDNGERKYITITSDTKNFMLVPYNSILTKDDAVWKGKQLNALANYYRRAGHKLELMPIMEEFLGRDYPTLAEWTIHSIRLCMELLQIDTGLILQSDIDYDREQKRSDLVLELCRQLGASAYLSGRGASVQYLNRAKFAENHIDIVFQDFTHPVYPQCHKGDFVPGVSILDMLFNCGVEETRRAFWAEVRPAE